MKFSKLILCEFWLVLASLCCCCATSVSAQEFKFLEVKVFDENGKPMADVPVEIKMDGLSFPMPTNELGMISFNVSAGPNPVELRIEKPGYELQKIRWRRGSKVPAEYLIKLKLGKPYVGVVRDQSGRAVPGVQVSLATLVEPLKISNAIFARNTKQPQTQTDDKGKFSLPYQSKSPTIVCLAAEGWAQVTAGEEPLAIQLTPWAKVTGEVRHGDQAVSDVEVELKPSRLMTPGQPAVLWRFDTKTDATGKFAFDRVIEGRVSVAQRVASLDPDHSERMVPSHHVFTQLEAGKTSQVQIGGQGRTVVGKVVIKNPNRPAKQPAYGTIQLKDRKVVSDAVSSFFFAWGQVQQPAVRPDGTVVFADTSQMQTAPTSSYTTLMNPDGSFEIHDVPLGQYQITSQVYSPLESQQGQADSVLHVERIANCTIFAAKTDGAVSVDVSKNLTNHTKIVTNVIALSKQSDE